MKIRLKLKDPDGVGNSIQEVVNEKEQAAKDAGIEEDEICTDFIRERINSSLRPWVEYSEYVTIEIDTEAGTARVIKVGE